MLESLPPWRLALAYAPAATRDHWLTLLALDQRLADVVRPLWQARANPFWRSCGWPGGVIVWPNLPKTGRAASLCWRR
jgi:hypothetical protein